MAELIKNGIAVQDPWKILHLAAGDTPESVKLPVGQVLVPVSVWKARRAELIRREYEHGWLLGVWLAADESPAAIREDLDDFSVVAVAFDHEDSDNSLLSAHLLSKTYGYRGELRATGSVGESAHARLRQSGFNAFEIGHHAKHARVIPARAQGESHLVAAAA